MGQLGRIIFWILIVGIFGIIAALITVHRDLPIWIGIVIFFALFIVFSLLDSISWAIRRWYKTKKIEKLKMAGEKIETAGLRLVLQNALDYIITNHVAGGVKRFWQMPWVVFFGKATILRSKGLKLHTHFMVGDAEDEALQRNQVYVLDNFVIWCVDEELLLPNTPKTIEKQWVDFLRYIRSQNKTKPPIDQIVVELEAAILTAGEKTDIALNARSLKDRLDQVSLLNGYRQQVIFCITQCNTLPGFSEFVELIPESLRSQAMGYIVARPQKDSTSGEPINYIAHRADQVIDIALYDTSKEINTEVFKFPLSLRAIKGNYEKFAELFFAPSSYTEPAVLHGVYLLGEYKRKNGVEESVFYYDFIEQIQLSLIRPMSLLSAEIKQQSQQRWKRLGIWYLLSALAAGYLIYVYNKTSNRLIDLVRLLPKKEAFTDQLEQNLLHFSDFHALMDKIYTFKHQLQIEVLPYRGGLGRLYNFYSQQFVHNFKTHVLDLLDDRIKQLITLNPTDTQKAYLVQNMVSRINLIQAKLFNQADKKTIMQMPDPQIRYLGYNRLPERFLDGFGLLYKDYIIWNSQTESLRIEGGKLTQWLDQSGFLASDLRWLVAWGNTQNNATEVTLNNFWTGSNVIRNYAIQPAYTLAGVVAIQSLLVQIQHALPLYIDISRQEKNFGLWLAEGRITAWKVFSLNFYKGTQTLAYQYEWDQTFDHMLQPKGPYNAILRRIATEFRTQLPLITPHWIQLVLQFSDLMNYRYDSDQGVEFKQLSNLIAEWLQKLEERPSQWKNWRSHKKPAGVNRKLNFNTQVTAVKAYIKYRDLLKKLYKEPYVQSVKAYGNARALYESQIEVSSQTSLVMQAYLALVEVRRSLDHYDQMDDSNPFWVLMRGPLDFYIDYTNRYASCYLQQKWLDEVYLKTVSLEGAALNQTLFGKGGLVWDFNKKYAQPFVKQVGNTFLPRFVLDHAFPFNQQYFSLLAFGMTATDGKEVVKEVQRQLEDKLPIDLTINAKPTNLDVRAVSLPYKTELRIKCKDKEFVLDNYNYPSQQTLKKWQLDSCGPTEINLFFPGGITLPIEYSGNNGFLHFLQDFDNGFQIFYPSKFPDHARFLKENKIDKIRVSYFISGASEIIWLIGKYLAAEKGHDVDQLRFSRAVKVPTTIADCWDQGMYDVQG